MSGRQPSAASAGESPACHSPSRDPNLGGISVLTASWARLHPADPDSMYCCCTIHGRCGAPGPWPTHHTVQKRRRPSGREHRPRCPTPARRPPGKPPIAHFCTMGRRPHTEPRVAAFVVADTIRSGHHPVALRCVTERAATALQRSPLELGRAESDCLLAAHSRSQAFESPGGPRSEERTRHRLIIPAARDLPLLAMLITETVTSLGPCRPLRDSSQNGVCSRASAREISAGRTQKLRLTHRQTALLRCSAPSPSRFTAKPSRASHG